MGLADTARLAVQLDLSGNFAARMRANTGALGKFDAAVSRSQTRAKRAGQQIGAGIANAGKIIKIGMGAAAAAIVASLKVAGDFEAQMNTINTVALASSQDLAKAGKGIRSLAREYGSTFAPISDLTAAEYDLVSAGIKLQDSQAGLTTSVRLGIGSYGTSAEAVDVLTTAINSYNLKTKDGAVRTGAFVKLSDELAQAVADGKVKLSEIAGEYATVAPIAAQAGIGTDEIAAALGRITATGSSAGATLTQMSRAIIELQKPSATLTALQKKFHKSYQDIAKDKGLNIALEEMRVDAEKAGVPFINLFGRVEAYKFALNTTGSNSAAFRAELDRVRHSAGALDKQVSERTKGLNFQLGRTKALFKDALITLGSPSLPKVAGLFERLNKAIDSPAFQSNLANIGDSIAGLFSEQNIQQGTDAIKNAFGIVKEAAPVIAESARITGEVLKTAVNLFQSLPPELQAIAIAGLTVNKLTGGLVTNLAGGLIEAVVKRLVSAVVNVTGAVVNVVGGGLPGGALPSAAVGAAEGVGLAEGGAAAAALGLGTITAGVAAGTAVAALGIMGLGWLINATSSRAQLDANAANVIDANRRRYDPNYGKPGSGTGPQQTGGLSPDDRQALSDAIKATDTNSERHGIASSRPDLSADTRAETRGIRNAIDDFATSSKRIFNRMADAAHIEFRKASFALSHAVSPATIRAALKRVNASIFDKGIGGSGGAKVVLRELKTALAHTDDPKLRAELKAEIRKVEKKITGREWVEKQIHKADAILKTGSLTNTRMHELAAIERALKDRGVPNAAKAIQAKIDAAKRAQTAAAYAAARTTNTTINRKNFSPKIVIPVTTQSTTIINGRTFVGTVNRQSILVRPGQAAVGS